ncbi:calmodulin-regulated spectrin-associated protein 1a [Trichomycterus rosablanca]|uniref:calmodulin-regulated spectrin-associated protein 1a n=1 Tax=Trichomycterus rosablanca TaxID=2290929 RepID=UPI002F360A05
MDSDEGDGGLEIKIVPPELYDSARAKIDANLRWLFAKAYGEDCVPDDLRDPFYVDQYGVEHIKPPVLELLLSVELYSRVCMFLSLGEQSATRHTHLSVLQVLARQSIDVLEPDGTPVTHHDLASTPIRMSSHIPLIDALMMACTMEMVNVERVMSSIKRFSSYSSTKELQVPLHMEEAMLFWINKVISRTREICEKELKLKQQLMDSPCHQKVRYRRDHVSSRILPHLPLVEDLMKDLCNGAALLIIIHYYCPEYMRLEDICLKEVLSISDSIYNLQLLKEFSSEYLNRCLYLSIEDLLYAPAVLKHNMMVFIAELFWWFEVVRPEFVKPRDPQEIKDVRASTQARSSRFHLPVSNAAKRSFLSSSPSVDSLSTGPVHDTYIRYKLYTKRLASGTKASPSYSLLSLKQRQQKPLHMEEAGEFRNRSNSLSRMDGHNPGPGLGPGPSPLSRLAWMEKKQRPLSQLETDWEHVCVDNISLTRSISKDSLASNVISVTPRHRINGQPSPSLVRRHDSVEKDEELVAVMGPETRSEGFFLEPLQPAVLRPNKEKLTAVSKQDESGEGRTRRRRGGHHMLINQSFSPIDTVEPQNVTHSAGFFLHGTTQDIRVAEQTPPDEDSDSEIGDEDEEDDTEKQDCERILFFTPSKKIKCLDQRKDEGESMKLCEDVRVQEHGDKDGTSGRCSPSSLSQASSTSTGTGRVTSFAERRLQHVTMPDGYSTGSTSYATTPDGSDTGTLSPDGKGGMASDLIHLKLQLEEKRRAIEAQKKKMEVLAARQRIQLGKAAFLNVVKKDRSDTLPHPGKQEALAMKVKKVAKDDACVEVLKAKSKENGNNLNKDRQGAKVAASPTASSDNRTREVEDCEEAGGNLDLSECSHSIELLNEAIGSIQQQMMQLSVQQELLMRQTLKSPQQEYVKKPHPPHEPDTKPRSSMQFVEISTAKRAPPKLSMSRSSRTKPSELKLNKDCAHRAGSKSSTRTPGGDARLSPDCKTPVAENEEEGGARINSRTPSRGGARNTTFRVHSFGNQRSEGLEMPKPESPVVEEQRGLEKDDVSDMSEEKKAQLIEVDLSELAEAPDSSEQKAGMGFFFKDDQKAADEMAKKRAAFLLKQQKKAEEARLRKQQLEAESELKRDEARRKAEEDRVRKEEEKARRELIKQEYLRKKQQELMEEQGVAKPRPHRRKPRPRSLHRGQSGTTTPVSLCAAPSGSSLSLASAATEADSVTSGGGSQRCVGESVESFPTLSRNASRNMERDWENGSTASSIASAAEYSGPRLFKEPSAKSNKPIIQNAIAHCCLAGKVNEAQKTSILDEIERCEANHLMILFRDGGRQFRAVYVFVPDTEELVKLTGTGPRAITRKMIDILFKYSSDRKQFTIIPAKTVSASVDAITIHNHLWQIKRHHSSTKRK